MNVDLRELPMVRAERAQARAELLRTVTRAHLGPDADRRTPRIAELSETAQQQLAAELLALPDLAALDAWLDSHT